jgi:hypothetical protein
LLSSSSLPGGLWRGYGARGDLGWRIEVEMLGRSIDGV